MIEQPGIIVEVLATALPAQATYFIQVTFVNMVATFGFEGFRLYPIAMAILRTFIGPRLTDKEKAISINSLGINPLSDPFEFEHAYYTSLMVSVDPKHRTLVLDSANMCTDLSICAGVVLHGVVGVFRHLSDHKFCPRVHFHCHEYIVSSPIYLHLPISEGQRRENMDGIYKDYCGLHVGRPVNK